jgi:hypothetical protein
MATRQAATVSLASAIVPSNGQQMRVKGVLGNEAVGVERLEQRDVWNSLLLQKIAQMMRVKGA